MVDDFDSTMYHDDLYENHIVGTASRGSSKVKEASTDKTIANAVDVEGNTNPSTTTPPSDPFGFTQPKNLNDAIRTPRTISRVSSEVEQASSHMNIANAIDMEVNSNPATTTLPSDPLRFTYPDSPAKPSDGIAHESPKAFPNVTADDDGNKDSSVRSFRGGSFRGEAMLPSLTHVCPAPSKPLNHLITAAKAKQATDVPSDPLGFAQPDAPSKPSGGIAYALSSGLPTASRHSTEDGHTIEDPVALSTPHRPTRIVRFGKNNPIPCTSPNDSGFRPSHLAGIELNASRYVAAEDDDDSIIAFAPKATTPTNFTRVVVFGEDPPSPPTSPNDPVDPPRFGGFPVVDPHTESSRTESVNASRCAPAEDDDFIEDSAVPASHTCLDHAVCFGTTSPNRSENEPRHLAAFAPGSNVSDPSQNILELKAKLKMLQLKIDLLKKDRVRYIRHEEDMAKRIHELETRTRAPRHFKNKKQGQEVAASAGNVVVVEYGPSGRRVADTIVDKKFVLGGKRRVYRLQRKGTPIKMEF